MADNTFTSFHLKPLVVAEKPKPKTDFNLEELRKKLTEIQKPKEVVKVKKVRKVRRPKPEEPEPLVAEPIPEPIVEPQPIPIAPETTKTVEQPVKQIVHLPTERYKKKVGVTVGTHSYDYQVDTRVRNVTHSEDPLMKWILNGRDDDVDQVEEMVKLPSWHYGGQRRNFPPAPTNPQIAARGVKQLKNPKNAEIQVGTDEEIVVQKRVEHKVVKDVVPVEPEEDPLVKWILNGRQDDFNSVEKMVKLPRQIKSDRLGKPTLTRQISQSATHLNENRNDFVRPTFNDLRRKSADQQNKKYTDEDIQFQQWIMNGAKDYKQSPSLLKLPKIRETNKQTK